jgi:hypothetical protein
MLREELDHPMTVGIADRTWRIHDHGPRALRIGEAVKGRTAFAHDEHVCAMSIERGIGGDKFDTESRSAKASATRMS